ncbi:MAG: hypothetical protein ABFD50_14550 [Smithella sp.]
MKRFVFFAFVLFLIVGCGIRETNLRRETARVVGDITPEEVTLSNVEWGMTNVDWLASTPKGNYRCSSDDMLRRPYCLKAKKNNSKK